MANENTTKNTDESLKCSFCGKGQKEVRKLIAGPTVYICDECINLCNEIMAEEFESSFDINSRKAILFSSAPQEQARPFLRRPSHGFFKCHSPLPMPQH
jgi:hypothetical protein